MSEDRQGHPYLGKEFAVRWSTLGAATVEADIRLALEEAGERLGTLAGGWDVESLSYANTVRALEEATEGLGEAWGKVSHLQSVNDHPELRAAYNAMLPEVSEFYARLPLDAGLWSRLSAYAETGEARALAGARARHLDEVLADFRRHGAELDVAGKARLEDIEKELARLTQKYGENVLDSTNAWEKIVYEEGVLAGLPGPVKDAAREDALGRGHGTEEAPAWRLTLKAPSMGPVLEHVHDRGLRREVWEASLGVGRGGDYDNTELVWEILRLRQEKAELLGYGDFADYVLERRMAGDGARAAGFVAGLRDQIAGAFEEECEALRAYREAETGEGGLLEPWDVAYWSERRRKALFDFEQEELRPYLAVDRVMAGMFELAQRIFGVRIEERAAVYGEAAGEGQSEVWHPEVKFYEIYEGDGRHLGSFYADWHPRDAKRGGAWMNYLRTGRRLPEEGLHEPHLGLICGNMTPGSGGKPALLTHDEVVTVFHEFGHLLHHLLGDVEVPSLSGVNVAWDFVELPSQLMENFCWERESLDLIARHHETGEAIPEELYGKMRAARTYGEAIANMRQLSLGALDLALHREHARSTAGAELDLDELTWSELEGYLMPLATRAPSMARRFSHLFSSPTGYAAGYYSYKWAEVLDADAFTRFLEEGVMNPEVGMAYRRAILERGNSAPPEELFRDFMGRDPDPGALLRRAGLAA